MSVAAAADTVMISSVSVLRLLDSVSKPSYLLRPSALLDGRTLHRCSAALFDRIVLFVSSHVEGLSAAPLRGLALAEPARERTLRALAATLDAIDASGGGSEVPPVGMPLLIVLQEKLFSHPDFLLSRPDFVFPPFTSSGGGGTVGAATTDDTRARVLAGAAAGDFLRDGAGAPLSIALALIAQPDDAPPSDPEWMHSLMPLLPFAKPHHKGGGVARAFVTALAGAPFFLRPPSGPDAAHELLGDLALFKEDGESALMAALPTVLPHFPHLARLVARGGGGTRRAAEAVLAAVYARGVAAPGALSPVITRAFLKSTEQLLASQHIVITNLPFEDALLHLGAVPTGNRAADAANIPQQLLLQPVWAAVSTLAAAVATDGTPPAQVVTAALKSSLIVARRALLGEPVTGDGASAILSQYRSCLDPFLVQCVVNEQFYSPVAADAAILPPGVARDLLSGAVPLHFVDMWPIVMALSPGVRTTIAATDALMLASSAGLEILTDIGIIMSPLFAAAGYEGFTDFIHTVAAAHHTITRRYPDAVLELALGIRAALEDARTAAIEAMRARGAGARFRVVFAPHGGRADIMLMNVRAAATAHDHALRIGDRVAAIRPGGSQPSWGPPRHGAGVASMPAATGDSRGRHKRTRGASNKMTGAAASFGSVTLAGAGPAPAPAARQAPAAPRQATPPPPPPGPPPGRFTPPNSSAGGRSAQRERGPNSVPVPSAAAGDPLPADYPSNFIPSQELYERVNDVWLRVGPLLYRVADVEAYFGRPLDEICVVALSVPGAPACLRYGEDSVRMRRCPTPQLPGHLHIQDTCHRRPAQRDPADIFSIASYRLEWGFRAPNGN